MSIVAFDIETTGLDKSTCRITQISLVKFLLNADGSYEIKDSYNTYVNPGLDATWSDHAQLMTGITPESVTAAPSFAEISDKVLDFIGDNDILTYNGNTFDIPILKNELARLGKSLTLYGRKIYDSLYIESKLNSRKLIDVYRKYTGKELDNAHNSLSDTLATMEVFGHQLNMLNNDTSDFDFETTCGGLVGMLDGERCFLQGKYKGYSVKSVLQKDPSYITYFIKQGDPDFYLIVKEIYESLKKESKKLS